MNTQFTGRVGADPKIIQGANGNFLSMDVATDYYCRGENKTMWVRVRCTIDNRIEKLIPYFKKGTKLDIVGKQQAPEAYIGKDGEAHASIVIVAHNISFADSGRKADGSGQSQTQDLPISPANDNEPLPF